MKRLLFVAAFSCTASFGLAMPAAASPDRGETLFQQRCQMCHTHAPNARNGVGPNLWRLSGRKAASAPNFQYSTSLAKSALTWTPRTLDRFLTAPNKMVPGTRMAIGIPDPADRKAVVDFLLKGKK